MGAVIQEYDVEIGFRKALPQLRKIMSVNQKMNRINENSLSRQIQLQKRLNALAKANKSGRGAIGGVTSSSSSQRSTKGNKDAHVKARGKAEDKAVRERKALQEKILDLKAKEILLNNRNLTAEQQQTKEAMNRAINDAKSVRQLNRQIAAAKTQLAIVTQQTKELKKQREAQERAAAAAAKQKPRPVQDAHVRSRGKSEHRAARERVALEQKILDLKAKEMLLNSRNLTAEQQRTKQAIEQAMLNAKNVRQLNRQVAAAKTQSAVSTRHTNELRKQNFLMQRLNSSSQQFASNMVSAFAISAGATGVVKVGQEFESVRATMLAVSEGTEAAGKNFQFVRDEAFRLGLDLKQGSKGFGKMLAARGDMSLEDTKEAFIGVSEMGALLGLSSEQQNRTVNALMQMMSKGVVTAEELKLQMGDVLPNALGIMAKAAQDAGISVSGSYKELLELQKAGKVVSSKVLPHFAKRMREAAKPGMEKVLNSNRVAMNQLKMSIQEASDEFFRGGFAEGLTALFKSLTALVQDNTDLWRSLGKMSGSTLQGIAWIVKKVLHPVFKALGRVLKFLTGIFGELSGAISPIFTTLIKKYLPQSIQGLLSMRTAMQALMVIGKRLILPFIAILGVLEEIALFFNPEEGVKTFIGININDVKKEIAALKEAFTVDTAGSIVTALKEASIIGTVSSVSESVSQGEYNAIALQLHPLAAIARLVRGTAESAPTSISGISPKIVVESTVVMPDGEVLAEAVTETTSFTSAMDRHSVTQSN